MSEGFAVSWKMIEPHWKVVSADGEEIGEVFETVGDRDEDIFDGLAITRHGGPSVVHEVVDKPRYVSCERVVGIDTGVVTLAISASDADRLPEHDVPMSAEISSEEASRTERAATWLEDVTGQDHFH